MERLKMVLAVAFASALMLGVMAGPAFAFHHAFLPGGACGQSENAGGKNPVATGAIVTHNPAQGQELPLPPTGTPAADHSDRITNPPETVECPAPR